jgi:hypothetical protein
VLENAGVIGQHARCSKLTRASCRSSVCAWSSHGLLFVVRAGAFKLSGRNATDGQLGTPCIAARSPSLGLCIVAEQADHLRAIAASARTIRDRRRAALGMPIRSRDLRPPPTVRECPGGALLHAEVRYVMMSRWALLTKRSWKITLASTPSREARASPSR